MNPMLVFLFAMEFVSILLAVILAIAWNSFGRPHHALSWCAAFGVGAIGWAGSILEVAARPDDPWLATGVELCSMATWALMLLGFRQRAGRHTHRWRAIAALGLPAALLASAQAAGLPALTHSVPYLFAAAALVMSAGTMMFRPSSSQAERATITILLAFAILDLIVGSIALFYRLPMSADPDALYHVLMMLSFPSAFTGTGLFAVFLLAADLADRMSRLAAVDPLTGVLNRRGFEEAAARAVANARRQGQPLTIVMADIDRFKVINDRHGHGCGDRVLCRFADHMAGSIRAGDLLGRVGGEEFAMVLVDAWPSTAMDVVDRVRMALGELAMPVGNEAVHITASFGMTGVVSPDEDLGAMLARADEALYRSKIAGRDRVTLAPPPPPLTIPVERKELVGAGGAAPGISGTAAR